MKITQYLLKTDLKKHENKVVTTYLKTYCENFMLLLTTLLNSVNGLLCTYITKKIFNKSIFIYFFKIS